MSKEVEGLNLGSIIKGRIHLFLISIIPLLIIVYGIYLMIQSENKGGTKFFDLWGGMIVGGIGLILLIIVFIISAIRKLKNENIINRQKAHFKNQKNPKRNLLIFIGLVIFIFLYVYFKGKEGFKELASLWDILIYILVLLAIYKWIKK